MREKIQQKLKTKRERERERASNRETDADEETTLFKRLQAYLRKLNT